MLPTAPPEAAALFQSLFPDVAVSLLQAASLQQQHVGIPYVPFPTAGVNMANIASGTKHDGFIEPSSRFLIPPGGYEPAVLWSNDGTSEEKKQETIEKEEKRATDVTKEEDQEPEEDFVFEMGRVGKENYFPAHFMRGTIISVADGKEKTVGQLSSDDFLMSSALTTSLDMETCVVLEIVQVKECSRVTFMIPSKSREVSLEVQNEYPFFALGKGWSSCDPRGTLKTFGLDAKALKVGDICITLIMDEKTEGTMGTASVPDAILEDRKRVLPQVTGSEDGRRSAPPLGYGYPQLRTRTWSGSTPCPQLT